ncbi:hypothetical protein [uncultured Nonlabens sp.]|uniref:hypothetical protein n=1 Tax=uncultured Nonlabens sp. TaxID=859306 RepID=UPI002603D206|nr:hypothetical protein [uncultured Nonlabens sp.]
MRKILYKETQKFDQWWLWLIVLSLSLISILQFNWSEDLLGQLTTDKIIPSILPVVILVLFLTLKMTTVITDEKITVIYSPLVKKEFYWRDLDKAQVIDYGFIGGWGIRLWTSYGTVYNVKGTKGLHIKVAGKQYVIGTQKEKELRSTIEHLLK